MCVTECGLPLGDLSVITVCQQMFVPPKVSGVSITIRGRDDAPPIHIPRAYRAQIPDVVQNIAGHYPGAKVDISSYRGEKQPIVMTPHLAEHWLEDFADHHAGRAIIALIIHNGEIIAKFVSTVWTAVGDFIRANTEQTHLVLLELA